MISIERFSDHYTPSTVALGFWFSWGRLEINLLRWSVLIHWSKA